MKRKARRRYAAVLTPIGVVTGPKDLVMSMLAIDAKRREVLGC